jgi:hypothetical protein
MSTLVDVVAALAVVTLIVVRQVRPQRAIGGRRWWIVPAVLIYLAVREPGLLDPRHQAAAALLLAAELLIGILMGAAWAWTSRIWTESDGSVWVRGTKATVAVWIIGIAVCLALAGVGVLMGIHQGSSALLLALAASLLVRSGLLAWRAGLMNGTPGRATSYGDGVRAASWKDPV